MIKEFKNGNITINIKEDIKSGYYEVGDFIDNFYNEVLTMTDLYFNSIDGVMYLTSYRTNYIYDFSEYDFNVLKGLENELINNDFKIKLFPISKKESIELWDIYNSME